MSTLIRWLAILAAGALSVVLAQRLIRRAYKSACEKYSVVPELGRNKKGA